MGGRRRGVEYHAEHIKSDLGSFELLIVTNDGAPEFRLVSMPGAPIGLPDPPAWTPVRTPDAGERLESVEAFASHVVLVSRADGHTRLRIVASDDLDAPGIVVDPVPPIGSVAVSRNEEFSASSVTVVDESYLMPPVWSSVAFASGTRTELLRKEAPGFDAAAYVGEQRSFASVDGTPVPATILRRRDTPLDGSAPCVMYAYGAYESVFPDEEWDPAIPSLLDRGVVYVHAHVRGGGEGGRRWWLDGRMEHKQHTFDDHIAVADGLAEAGLVDGALIATRGLSAGGLLQGAVFSQRPDRWRAVVAEVPFIDVVTTMLDPTIPLTINEWDEWGDPSRPEDYAWMARLLAIRQPASGWRPSRPAGHGRRPRCAGDGLGAGQVGRRPPRDRPRVGAALPVPRRDRRRRPRRPLRPLCPPGLRGRGLRLAAGSVGGWVGLGAALVAPGWAARPPSDPRADRRRRVAGGCFQRGCVAYARATPRF